MAACLADKGMEYETKMDLQIELFKNGIGIEIGFGLIWLKLWKNEKEAVALHFHIQTKIDASNR